MDELPGGMERGMKRERERDGDIGGRGRRGGGGGGVFVMYSHPLLF